MTKQELLNSIIDITVKTGQGMSGFIGETPGIQSMLDELVAENYITKHTQHFNHLPDDAFYMPVGCYNLWVDYDSDKSVLFYIRMYLKQKDLGLSVDISQVIDNPDFMLRYANWLNKNYKELEKIKTLKPVPIKSSKKKFIPFTTSELKFIRSKDWYKENKNINICLNASKDALDRVAECARISEELISLYKTNPGKYQNDLDQTSKKLVKYQEEMNVRIKLHVFLKDKTGKIQKLIK